MVYEKFLRLELCHYDIAENSPGALLSNLASDSGNINSIVLTFLGTVVQVICCCGLCVVICFIYDWRISLISLFFVPLNIFGSLLYFKVLEGQEKQGSLIDGFAGNILSESVCNTKTLFSYNMQRNVVKSFNDIIMESHKKLKKQCFVNGIFFGVSQFILYISYSIIFYASGVFISDGSLTLGNMLKVFLTAMLSSVYVGTIQSYVGDLENAYSSLNSIFKIVETPSSIDPLQDIPQSLKPLTITGKIEFKNVSFSYPTRKQSRIFSNLSFVIEPGQSVAFVGLSGSGKSTIIQLIERFYDVDEGSILIDDVDIRSYDIVSIRKFISLVSQEPVLFKRSISENIKYGKLEAEDSEIEEYALKARISRLLNSDKGNGIPVSGGEKQRIAIARAMIKNPRILLLDEATSALDKESEEEVQKSLEEMMIGRTSIIVAHR